MGTEIEKLKAERDTLTAEVAQLRTALAKEAENADLRRVLKLCVEALKGMERRATHTPFCSRSALDEGRPCICDILRDVEGARAALAEAAKLGVKP